MGRYRGDTREIWGRYGGDIARLGDGDGGDVAREEEAGRAALALRRAAELGQRAAP